MKNEANKKRLVSILVFFGIFVALGIILISIYGITLSSVSTSIVWMLACIMAGSAIGFLFGIPKIMQPSGNTENVNKAEVANSQSGDGDYKLLVNTNLTEISDWLTKIIVGLGLVNLTKLPPYITSIALSFSNGINGKDKSSALAFAYGLITCYTILGFLFGYLFTRLVLTQAFADADRASIQQVKEALSSQTIQLANLESKQGLITHTLYPETGENENIKTAQRATTPENQLAILSNMAVEYMNISVADWAERTRLKDATANIMADYALKQNISKTAIFQIYQQDKNEGMALALASLINIKPEIGDIENLLKSGQGITRLHVRFRFLLAIVTLHNNGFINEKDRNEVISLVNSYKKNADRALLKMIDSTLSTLNS